MGDQRACDLRGSTFSQFKEAYWENGMGETSLIYMCLWSWRCGSSEARIAEVFRW